MTIQEVETESVESEQEAKQEVKEITASKEEQVGFHKGSLSTLAKEREELLKIVNITEQLMQVHIEALKKLGVDLEAMAKKASEEAKKSEKTLEESI